MVLSVCTTFSSKQIGMISDGCSCTSDLYALKCLEPGAVISLAIFDLLSRRIVLQNLSLFKWSTTQSWYVEAHLLCVLLASAVWLQFLGRIVCVGHLGQITNWQYSWCVLNPDCPIMFISFFLAKLFCYYLLSCLYWIS